MDFVIPWVDSSDPEWKKEYLKYRHSESGDKREARFRDWENLKCWFRGVEVFAPWVDRVHFITYGHYPNWLNLEHPKLNIVKHDDFIPDKYLPTFNSRVIALNLHRIKSLKEQYVYFNDDVFIIDHIKEKDFFRDNKPCDMAVSNTTTGYTHSFTVLKNIAVINKYFSKHEAIKRNPFKWINIKYGLQNIRTLLLLPWDHTGFFNPHLAQPNLKSTLKLLWEKEYGVLDEACNYKFREYYTVNDYLPRYWELASNNFHPFNLNRFGKYFDLHEIDISKVSKVIEGQKRKIIALNDQDVKNFEVIKKKINSSLNKVLAQKSDFEL